MGDSVYRNTKVQCAMIKDGGLCLQKYKSTVCIGVLLYRTKSTETAVLMKFITITYPLIHQIMYTNVVTYTQNILVT